MELGKIIRQLRCEKHVSQKQLATYLHVSISTISNYESGIHYPDPVTLCHIADYFHVSADYLLGRSAYKDIPLFMLEYSHRDSILFKIIQIYFGLSKEYRKTFYTFGEFLLSQKKNK